MSLEINTEQYKSPSIMIPDNHSENNHTTVDVDSPEGNPLTNNINSVSTVCFCDF